MSQALDSSIGGAPLAAAPARRVLLVGEPPEWRPEPSLGGRVAREPLELVATDFARAETLLGQGGFEVAVVNLGRDAAARLEAVRRWRRQHRRPVWLALTGPEPLLSEEVMLRAGIAEVLDEDEVVHGLARAVRRAEARAAAEPGPRALDWESPSLKASRLSSLGTVAAGLAHEINNPLAYVRSNLEFVLEEFGVLTDRLERLVKRFPNVAGGATGFPDLAERMDELRTAMDEANEGVTRVTDVVGGLKHFSTRPRTEIAELHLGDVARASLRIAQRTVSDRARFETRLDPVPAVRGNTAYLGQVVLNLLVNAAQAIPEPEDGVTGEYRIRLATYRSPDGQAVLEVSDTGPGMTPEVSARIFEPFFTTKPEGSGLGLAVSRQVVEAFGGRLVVETAPGEGATFRVLLPAA